jgi:hypothetical protein
MELSVTPGNAVPNFTLYRGSVASMAIAMALCFWGCGQAILAGLCGRQSCGVRKPAGVDGAAVDCWSMRAARYLRGQGRQIGTKIPVLHAK